MTPKQERFVAEYLKDLNATQAAIRAGYATASARQIAAENLSKPDIEAAVAAGKAQQLAACGLSAERVLEELRRIAFSDLRRLFTPDGDLRSVCELSDEEAATLASVEVIIKNAAAGDGQTDTIHKIRAWDKVRGLELLAKHFGLLTERLEHRGEVAYRWLSE